MISPAFSRLRRIAHAGRLPDVAETAAAGILVASVDERERDQAQSLLRHIRQRHRILTQSQPMLIRIDKCTSPGAWYAQRVGQTIAVERFETNRHPSQGIPEDVYWCREGGTYNCINYVRASDATVLADAARQLMKLYLAGPIAGCTDEECNGWRSRVKTLHPDVFDPMVRDARGLEHLDPTWIVEGDKADIDQSDALLVWYVKPTVGTSMEILYAWERSKPVIVVNNTTTPISPWITYHATAIVPTIEEALAVVRAIREGELAFKRPVHTP